MERIKIDAMILQDGGRFYDYDTGIQYFESSLHVKDFDMQTAIVVREEFIKWAKHKGLVIAFVR